MKELFKAKEIHQEIIELDKEIIKLESNLDKVIREKLDGSVKLTINLAEKEKLKLDEDGSIVQSERIRREIFDIYYGVRETDKKDESKEMFESNLSETELILMFATLLRYKQDKRKKLINDFNKLNLKLKI